MYTSFYEVNLVTACLWSTASKIPLVAEQRTTTLLYIMALGKLTRYEDDFVKLV